MSNHDTLMAAGSEALRFAHFGDAITYTPAGGSPASIRGVVSTEDLDTEAPTDGSRRRVRRRTVTITNDPDDTVNGGVASPATNATVTIAGEVWGIEDIDTVGQEYVLHVVKSHAAEVTRSGHYGVRN